MYSSCAMYNNNLIYMYMLRACACIVDDLLLTISKSLCANNGCLNLAEDYFHGPWWNKTHTCTIIVLCYRECVSLQYVCVCVCVCVCVHIHVHLWECVCVLLTVLDLGRCGTAGCCKLGAEAFVLTFICQSFFPSSCRTSLRELQKTTRTTRI